MQVPSVTIHDNDKINTVDSYAGTREGDGVGLSNEFWWKYNILCQLYEEMIHCLQRQWQEHTVPPKEQSKSWEHKHV